MDRNVIDAFTTRAQKVAELAKKAPLEMRTITVVEHGREARALFALCAPTGEQVTAAYELAQAAAPIAQYIADLEAELERLRAPAPAVADAAPSSAGG